MTAALRVVSPEPATDDDPLIAEGTYRATYVKHELVRLRMFGGAARVFITLRVVDPGEAFGVRLWRSYRVHPGHQRGFIAPKKGDLFRTVGRLLPTTRLRNDQLPVREAFASRVVLVRVRTVKVDGKQRPLPPNCHYSVIDEVLGAETNASLEP